MEELLVHQFTYHSVGQGLFFEGSFCCGGENISLVYDCGAEKTYRASLQRSIKKVQNRLSHIDILVVSHFDFDHISGMHQLLKQCTVSHIILLYLTSEEILIYLLTQKHLSSSEVDWYRQFLNNPLTVLSEFESVQKVTYVIRKFNKSIWSQSLELDEPEVDNNTTRLYNEINVELKNDTEYHVVNGYLRLKFYNYPISSQKRSVFMKKIKDEMDMHGDVSVDSLAHRILSNLPTTQIFKANYSYESDHNNVSLLMMYDFQFIKGSSLIVDVEEEQLNLFESEPRYNKLLINSRFVHFLTGDISLKYIRKHKQIYKHYKDLLPHVDAIQIPHHGSKYNWNRDLLGVIPKKTIFIVSSGIKNKYKHPHIEVVRSASQGHSILYANNNKSVNAKIL